MCRIKINFWSMEISYPSFSPFTLACKIRFTASIITLGLVSESIPIKINSVCNKNELRDIVRKHSSLINSQSNSCIFSIKLNICFGGLVNLG